MCVAVHEHAGGKVLRQRGGEHFTHTRCGAPPLRGAELRRRSRIDVAALEEMGLEVIGADLLQKGRKVRHNPAAIARIAVDLAQLARERRLTNSVVTIARETRLQDTGVTLDSMINDAAVVILAAGQGTRMKSRMAKVLHRAGGKPLVRHAIDAALEIAPPERVFVVVGYQAEEVSAEVEAAGVGPFIRPNNWAPATP